MGEEKLNKKLRIKDGDKLAKRARLKKKTMNKKENNEQKISTLVEIGIFLQFESLYLCVCKLIICKMGY